MNEEIMEQVKVASEEVIKRNPEMKDLVEFIRSQTELVQNGATIAELRGITPEQLEAVYSVGFNFYKTGRYDEAEKVFRPLMLLDFYNAKYAFAFASSLQAQRKFEQATRAYAMVTILDAEDPRPLYHTAECMLALGDQEQALAALDMMQELAVAKDERSRTYIAKGIALKAKLEG